MAYKMKGNPMQRNFGIGSPAKQVTHGPGQDWEHDHKERPAHQDTPEAHGVTPPPKPSPNKVVFSPKLWKTEGDDPISKAQDFWKMGLGSIVGGAILMNPKAFTKYSGSNKPYIKSTKK